MVVLRAFKDHGARFVNIFMFNKSGLIVKQYDYYDNADYFKAVEKSKGN